MKSTKPIVVAMVSLLTLFTAIAIVGVIGDATSGKDNAARWGPASECFAGWATAVALVVGLAAFVTQLRDRGEDEEADAHEQQAEADQVVVKYGNRNPAGTEDKPIWVVTFEVWNYSRRPVKRVSVRSNVSEERCVVAGSLQPDERGPGQFVLTRSDTAGPPGGARPTFEVFFTDWRRTTWRRPENGDATRA